MASTDLSKRVLWRSNYFWSALMLFAVMLAGGIIQRGPAPLGANAPADRPAAGRMREQLEQLLGDPPMIHTTGTEAGERFLQRLERAIESSAVQTRRIEIPWDIERIGPHLRGRFELIPEDATLKNLLAIVPGTATELKPVLIVTHHDSCIWGPGAGDAGSAVVALLETIRILSRTPPNRTTYFLFTDAEEYGLVGATAISLEPELPFEEPAFVLNFDARGSTRAVPMFETHAGNHASIQTLINDLAFPRITTSLAVTVYRMLPNATDFNVWDQRMGWAGFNFATIGGAHRYHTPEDVPENLSDRMLQHMGDHVFEVQQALDSLDQTEMAELGRKNEPADDAVFFDLFGFVVIYFRESMQRGLAVTALISCLVGMMLSKSIPRINDLAKTVALLAVVVLVGYVIGLTAKLLLLLTPLGNLRYTPIDLPVGLVTVSLGFVSGHCLLESTERRFRLGRSQRFRDVVWIGMAVLGLVCAFASPGGAYLLVVPSLAYGVVRLVDRRCRFASWLGWISLTVLAGPLLVLLVQSLGPWMQPVYGAIAGALAVPAMTVWAGGQVNDFMPVV